MSSTFDVPSWHVQGCKASTQGAGRMALQGQWGGPTAGTGRYWRIFALFHEYARFRMHRTASHQSCHCDACKVLSMHSDVWEGARCMRRTPHAVAILELYERSSLHTQLVILIVVLCISFQQFRGCAGRGVGAAGGSAGGLPAHLPRSCRAWGRLRRSRQAPGAWAGRH